MDRAAVSEFCQGVIEVFLLEYFVVITARQHSSSLCESRVCVMSQAPRLSAGILGRKREGERRVTKPG